MSIAAPATLHFDAAWHEWVSAPIERGKPLRILYDPGRLPQCRLNMHGAEFWNIWLYARFHPAGEFYTASMLEGVRPTPHGPVTMMQPVPFDVDVPSDAEQIELWFRNQDTYYWHCNAWDSRFSQNYWFDAAGVPPSARRNVSYRAGAIPDLGMVNVFGAYARKENVFPLPPVGSRQGSDLQTRMSVAAWVRNVAYRKYVWMDVHVFGGQDQVIHAETVPLRWQMPEAGDGDSFRFDGKIYQGSTATPGSVSPRPDARKVQYRLYYEVSDQVYTDSILHEYQLQEDAITG